MLRLLFRWNPATSLAAETHTLKNMSRGVIGVDYNQISDIRAERWHGANLGKQNRDVEWTHEQVPLHRTT